MRIVWHCEDRAGSAMAGPAIRAVELASRLAAKHDVTLACPGANSLPPHLRAAKGPGSPGRNFSVRELSEGESIRPLLQETKADALVAQGFGFPARDLAMLPSRLRLVADLYDPVLLELLARAGHEPEAKMRLHLFSVRARLLFLLARADHVLCASERQRAFWLGWLGAVARLTPEALAKDPAARSLLALVPFGTEEGLCPNDLHAKAAQQLRAAAGEGEQPVLWWGGLWDWMDPQTAIRAVARVRAGGHRAALVLPAGNRPGADAMDASRAAESEARRLGLWEKGVNRLPEWIPYAQRGPLLAAAAVAVSCHLPSLEAELAFRTRLLDCVWARLPVVCTGGDELSVRAEREGWGANVLPGDDAALADKLIAMLDPKTNLAARAKAAEVSSAYQWDQAAAPLLSLLENDAPARPAVQNALAPEFFGANAFEVAGIAVSKLWRALKK